MNEIDGVLVLRQLMVKWRDNKYIGKIYRKSEGDKHFGKRKKQSEWNTAGKGVNLPVECSGKGWHYKQRYDIGMGTSQASLEGMF